MAGSIPSTMFLGLAGVLSWCSRASSGMVAASNARLPVNISYSTSPRAKRSLRAEASRPSSCSGAM